MGMSPRNIQTEKEWFLLNKQCLTLRDLRLQQHKTKIFSISINL